MVVEMSDLVKVSDLVALFLKEKGIKHVFGIIGSANAHIFDSISKLGYTEIICVHHEQAATMAMQTYYRVTGKISAAIVTAGGGSVNAITGVMSAWADSVPGLVISGQENTRFIDSMEHMRMWGIQGYDSAFMVSKITKYSTLVKEPDASVFELEKAYDIAGNGRPGPVWVDFPMDVQGSLVAPASLKKYQPEKPIKGSMSHSDLESIRDLLRSSKRPVLWLGHGIRIAGAVGKIEELLKVKDIPVLLSWAGLDMLNSQHPCNFGSAGVYGNRAGNFVLQNADLVISIGNRMAIPMIGYDPSELVREGKIVQVDIDQNELNKLSDVVDISLQCDSGVFLDALINMLSESTIPTYDVWLEKCQEYVTNYPKIGPEHEDTPGYINSYKVIDHLFDLFADDQIITTDMGTALLSGHQAAKLNGRQRLMTSTGLGEMGYGLPAAIGASFGANKSEVIALNCDGGIMMNLQELQTISHHRLPIKTFIFNNDGYLMIKHTQKNLLDGRYTSTDKNSGISCPNFSKVAEAFDMQFYRISAWDHFDSTVQKVLASEGPVICEIIMDPEQYFYPKLSLAKTDAGGIVSPPLEDLSPILPRDKFRESMIVKLHPKSEEL
jgi:acetolactate synthase-1/2/3 large subunit|tara:strand:+ start:1306 stop:3132 length:1827 start_codon:yes stop_codon:yes gene_type:complete